MNYIFKENHQKDEERKTNFMLMDPFSRIMGIDAQRLVMK
ncbi:hypothetical protein BN1221_03610c [Brenneria goodwinii]|uniref:Uncharacterized protein n=1 Tax=Brenneria goodwinii TaxID=1109412 RepID=A0A0G4JYT2_9GAMM|nr:hypothetical protein BN1221_03610c [Brenneria goodwinii]